MKVHLAAITLIGSSIGAFVASGGSVGRTIGFAAIVFSTLLTQFIVEKIWED